MFTVIMISKLGKHHTTSLSYLLALCGHYVERELAGVTVRPGVIVKELIKVPTKLT